MSLTLSQWFPLSVPSSGVWTSVNPTATAGLFHTLESVIPKAETATVTLDLITYSRIVRGAEASLAVISAQDVLATATATAVQAFELQVIANSTANLIALDMEENNYHYNLKHAPNIIYFIIFTLVFIYNALMIYKSRYHWYNVTYFCGYGLEFCGWLGRLLSFHDTANSNFYILQFVSLTLAPAFIMAGVYFLFAQLVVIHGRQYSVLKPLWYSYMFITSDVVSLIIQAGGGASASIASQSNKDTTPGTNTLIAGISVQTFAMTVFICFYFEFLNRAFFRHAKEMSNPIKRTPANFIRLLFNAKSVRPYRQELEQFYNPKFQHIRLGNRFSYMPLAITVTVIVIYIRCVYRVVELAQGWSGYLISHEVYIMVLDAFMVAIAGLISVPFHPVWVFGLENVVKLATIKKNLDEEKDDKSDSSADQQEPGEFSESYTRVDYGHDQQNSNEEKVLNTD